MIRDDLEIRNVKRMMQTFRNGLLLHYQELKVTPHVIGKVIFSRF